MSFDRIAGLVRRVFRQSIDTNTPSQQVQIESLADEPHGDVEVLQPYGLEANPPVDVLEGLGVFVGGESDHGVVLGWFDKAHRPKGLEPGEVKFYSVFGQTIFFDKLGQVTITSQSGSKTEHRANGDIVHTPSSQVMRVVGTLEVSQAINAVGGINSQGTIHAVVDVTAAAVSLVGHRHSGVQAGPSNTGLPI